jgi:hypothetical protein
MHSSAATAPFPKQLKRLMRNVIAGFSAVAIATPTASVPVEPQPFVLEISAAQQKVRWGSQVELKLILTNTSDAEIKIVDTDRWCDYLLDVREGQGQLVSETVVKRETKCAGQEAAGRRIIITLKPHESFDDVFFVSEAYDVSRPGDYFIHAMREIPKELGKGTVWSNLATVTVDDTGEHDVRTIEAPSPPNIEVAPMSPPRFQSNPPPPPPQR